VQSLDLLGAQRDGRVTPAEAEIRVVPFGFSQVADVANKVERCPKITEMERSFDAVAIIAQFPVRSLRSKVLRIREREPRNASATGGALLLGGGSMDNNGSKLSDKSELPTELKLENTVDTSGMWFAAAVLFAVLAAGIIIYRAAKDDIRTAANHTLPAPASSSR
jgi:hypothetical protein